MIDRLNSEQRAPAFAPDTLAGFRIGDSVRLPAIDATLIVTGLQPPSILVLRAPSGAELRAGWQAVQRVRTRTDIEAKP
jgi:hypothetical protein